MPATDHADFEQCKVRLQLTVTADVCLPDLNSLGKYHYWYGAPGGDALYYDRPFCFGKRLQMAATGILGDEPTLTVNRTYFRVVSHRFMNLHSVGYVLTDLASLLLLRRGFTPLHCSAFKHANSTVVVAAAPNTGKTLTSMTACLGHAADYISEDLAISDGQDVFSVPWTSTFRYYKQIDQSLAARLRGKAIGWLPLLELFGARKPTPITDFVPNNRIVDRSRVTHVVLLERGSERLYSIGLDEAYRRVRNLNRYEFNYHKAPLAVAYEYFNPRLDIEAVCRAEEATIRRLLENCENLWIVRSHDPTRYAAMIVNAITARSPSAQTEYAVA
jgi:hypothetical protein